MICLEEAYRMVFGEGLQDYNARLTRDIEKPFEIAGKKAMFPDDFGDPEKIVIAGVLCFRR